MIRTFQEPTPLAVPVHVTVRHDLSVDFRRMNFGLQGIPDLVSGHAVTITHYDWHPHQIIVSFTDGFGDTRRYVADVAEPEMNAA